MKYFSDYVMRGLQLAIDAHKGQTDKAGREYIHHPVTVAMILAKNGYSDECIATALLHDVVEDTPYTIDDLRRMEFPTKVVDALALLTHDDATPYFDYLERLAPNPVARAVKLADLTHNLDTGRIAKPTEKDMKRWEKYRTALSKLKEL